MTTLALGFFPPEFLVGHSLDLLPWNITCFPSALTLDWTRDFRGAALDLRLGTAEWGRGAVESSSRNHK